MVFEPEVDECLAGPDDEGAYAIFVLDPCGIVMSWNADAQRIHGYAAAEIIGRHLEVFYPDDDRAAGTPRAELTIAAQRGAFQAQGWRLRRNGSQFLADAFITALRDDSGDLRGFAAVTRDETERIRSYENHHELEALAYREGVGAELGDTVVRGLFRVGLGLQATLGLIGNPEARARIESAIEELDYTIKGVRSIIWNVVRSPVRSPVRGAR